MIPKDKNIPIPEKKRGRKRIYPWNEMNVGDSFLMFKEATTRNSEKASSHGNEFSKRVKNGEWKFSVRQTEEGVRIWRIK